MQYCFHFFTGHRKMTVFTTSLEPYRERIRLSYCVASLERALDFLAPEGSIGNTQVVETHITLVVIVAGQCVVRLFRLSRSMNNRRTNNN